jgi:hypothetical protein
MQGDQQAMMIVYEYIWNGEGGISPLSAGHVECIEVCEGVRLFAIS